MKNITQKDWVRLAAQLRFLEQMDRDHPSSPENYETRLWMLQEIRRLRTLAENLIAEEESLGGPQCQMN